MTFKQKIGIAALALAAALPMHAQSSPEAGPGTPRPYSPVEEWVLGEIDLFVGGKIVRPLTGSAISPSAVVASFFKNGQEPASFATGQFRYDGANPEAGIAYFSINCSKKDTTLSKTYYGYDVRDTSFAASEKTYELRPGTNTLSLACPSIYNRQATIDFTIEKIHPNGTLLFKIKKR